MESSEPRHIEGNSDDICHEEDSDADSVDSSGKPNLISVGSDKNGKEDNDQEFDDDKDKDNKD